MPLLLLLWLLLVAAPASAGTTLAVLPLDKSTGSASYDGLGAALAGMIVADLTDVPELVLIERARLDAALSELALADGAYLDPATAQRLGQGLGAQVLVLGSWGVVDDTFLIDARLVEVETSRVLHAARADGPLEAFVAVEKEVVERLLDGLAVKLSLAARRQLQLQTPTEAFGAFAAYGEGLARQQEGRLDEAADAFSRAVSTDPAFADARAALASVRARIASMQAEDTATAATDRERRLRAVIAGTRDARTLPATHDDTLAELSAWALRLSALDQLDRHCDRQAEMLHHLERVQGAVAMPDAARRPYVLVEALSEQAWSLGLEDRPAASTRYSRDMRVMDAASVLGGPIAFLLDLDRVEHGHATSKSLYRSLRDCLGEPAALAEIATLRTALAQWGVGAWASDRGEPGVTVDDELEAFLLRAHIRTHGLDADAQARVTSLLDRHEATEARGWARRIAEAAVTEGEAWQRHRAMRQGLPNDVLVGMARAVAAGDAALLRSERPFCARVLPRRATSVGEALTRWEAERAGSRQQYAPWTLSRVGVDLAALLDFGCVAGVAPRFHTLDDAARWLDDAAARVPADRAADPTCAEALTRITAVGYAQRVASFPDETAIDVIDAGLSGWYGSFEASLCAPPTRATAR